MNKKITRTAEEAKEIREQKEKEYEIVREIKTCPECGYDYCDVVNKTYDSNGNFTSAIFECGECYCQYEIKEEENAE